MPIDPVNIPGVADTPEGRAAYIAKVLGVLPPARILDADCAPSQELGRFCLDTGASLDFIILCDMQAMLHGEHNRTRDAARMRLHIVDSRAVQVHALIRCMAVAEDNDTRGYDWKGTATVLLLAEELMDEIVDGVDDLERAPKKVAA